MFDFKLVIPKKAKNWLFLWLGLSFTPSVIASVSATEVGVIRSKENAQQWTQIVDRLDQMGVNYCVLDSRDWQEEKDINKVKVLLIPSVANISNEQAIALNNWVNKGGKIIVSGPTGTSSSPEVKEKLKNLFGAYWGFPVSQASTIMVQEANLKSNNQLSSNINGAVIIPTNDKSKTTAVWMSEGKPPAVVTGDNSTYFGWRWGVDNVSPVKTDTAWLNTTLKKYGVTSSNKNKNFSKQEKSCQSTSLVNVSSPTLNTVVIRPDSVPDKPIEFNQVDLSTETKPPIIAKKNSNSQRISNQEIALMSEQLGDLIHRVESTLISAEAKQVKYGLPMSKAFEYMVKTSDKNSSTNPVNFEDVKYGNNNAYQAILKAKETLANFPQLAITDYALARQSWLEARRELWDNYPVDRNFAQPEIRSVWLDRGTIVKARSKEDLALIFDRMAEAGINTVFFETVNSSYPIYPSKVAPEQNPLTKGWDPLKAAIELAHERKMELHAWVWVFAAANQGHNQILNQSPEYLGPLISRNPDWVLKDQNGEVFNKTLGFKKAFYDPANPEVRNYLLNLFEEITTNYDVDGIQLDYIRYPFQDGHTKQIFGYTDLSRRLFEQKTGTDPIKLSSSSPLWSQWTNFRIQQVDSFVAEVSTRLKQKRPDLIISAAVFPMQHRERLVKIQQNWEEWINQEWVDVMVLMTYALHVETLENRNQQAYDYSEQSSSLIVPGIRLLNIPYKEAVDQVQLLRQMPTGGYALFAAENFNPALESILKQTQGNVSSVTQPIPHRDPFGAIFARYQALQNEWSFLLIHHQIVIDPRYLKEWSQESDELNAALKKLSENPSALNIKNAQSKLTSFRQKLSQWTSKHKQVKPLQVKSWENRLITLENLLKYGERRAMSGTNNVAKQ